MKKPIPTHIELITDKGELITDKGELITDKGELITDKGERIIFLLLAIFMAVYLYLE